MDYYVWLSNTAVGVTRFEFDKGEYTYVVSKSSQGWSAVRRLSTNPHIPPCLEALKRENGRVGAVPVIGSEEAETVYTETATETVSYIEQRFF